MRKLVIHYLFLFFVLVGFTYKTKAQGWSFQFQLAYSGNCSGAPNITMPTLPHNTFTTQSQCENMRQQILAIKESGGGCTVYYVCTPCVGSDITTYSEVKPGEVSFDGQFEGKPLFTTHQSAAFEDWARDYRQQLESYGITSILGKNITPNRIPLTEDQDFNQFYNSLSDNFNPTTAPPKKAVNQDASVVDLSESKGVVQLLTTSEEQRRRDSWMEQQGLDHLQKIPKNGLPDLDPINYKPDEGAFWGAFVSDPEIVKMEKHAAYAGVALATSLVGGEVVLAAGYTAAESEAAATAASFLIPVVEESHKAIDDCQSGNCPTTGKIIENMGMAEVSNVVGTAGEALSGAIGGTKVIPGISKLDASELAKGGFKAVFGTADQTRDTGETLKIKWWGN